MKSNIKLSLTISTIISAHAAALAHADESTIKPAAASTAVEEVVVTATRRAESAQNVPIAITAMTGETLDQLNVQTADDLFKFLPNVTIASQGPGQSQIYMRGLAAVTTENNVSGGVGSFPNVAVYLDDQSAQLPGRNLDIYAADMQRIEVLEGPQGTLFGAGAQAGVLRYITNKPSTEKTDMGVKAGYATTAHGDLSNNVEAFLNLPLIAERLAVRGVFYNDTRGGYIDNVQGTYALPANAPGLVAYHEQPVSAACPQCTGLPTRQTINNSALLANHFNPVTYRGVRFSGLYKFTDDWSLLLTQTNQTLSADGVFAFDPAVGDLQVQRYNADTLRDKFSNTAWTIEGRLAWLKAIYTGAYLDRNVAQTTDYTKYAQSGFAIVTYMCNAGAASASNPAYGNVNQSIGLYGATECYTPSSVTQDYQQNLHMTHEVRLSTPDDWRVRAVGGLFYEDYKIKDAANFLYFGSTQAGFFPQAPPAGSTMVNPNVRPAGEVFYNDLTRGYKQKAAFGELAFDLLPKKLTLTGGVRFYSMDTYELGSASSDYYCRTIVTCTSSGRNLDAQNLKHTFSGHKGRVNLSYKPADDVLLYLTWSQGFRPGGFNRGAGVVNAAFRGSFTIPLFFDTDELTNKELGWKMSFFDRRLQFNGAVYQEDWKNVQLTVFNPAISNFTFSANGPNFRVRGAEGDVIFRATSRLTVQSSFSWNSSDQLTNLVILNNLGLPVSVFPTAGIGSSLAQAPPFQGNLRARYEFDVGGYSAYWQLAAQHTAHSYSSVLLGQRRDQAAYSTYDASLGVGKDAWTAELFAANFTDTRAQLFIDVTQNSPLITTNRPRTIGVRVSYHVQ